MMFIAYFRKVFEMQMFKRLFPFLFILFVPFIYSNNSNEGIELNNSHIKIVVDKNYKATVYTKDGKAWKLLASSKQFSFFLAKNGNKIDDFNLSKSSNGKINSNEYGECKSLTLKFSATDSKIELTDQFLIPDNFPNTVISLLSVKNNGNTKLKLDGYATGNFDLNAKDFNADSAYKFWSFQGGSYEARYDWIFPLTPHFQRDNFQGMNADDYGGGMPVVDLWTKHQGIAFASLSTVPELIYLPVEAKAENGVSFKLSKKQEIQLDAGESKSLVPFAIILHKEDYYNGIHTYANLMRAEGFKFYHSPKSAYEPEWCAWGYERNFKVSDILKSLDEVKKLGIEWVTIDDGWQDNDGDWMPIKSKFPEGGKSMKNLVDKIHAKGLKVRLWWVPLAAQDSSYSAERYPDKMKNYGYGIQSRVALQHPDWFILDKNGNRVKVSWWNSYYFCPAVKGVVNFYEDFVRRAINEWGIDGFKIDGQNFNDVPECYNESHHHKNPNAAPRALPDFFKKINGLALKLKPGFVIQMCPCGTNFSIYNLPYVNQLVASDPESAWQIRLKGKTYKAIFGNTVAYSGDHVELTNHLYSDETRKDSVSGPADFVSTLGIGGIPSTKFTVGGVQQPDSTMILTPKKENYYKWWISIYNKEKMSEGKYLNLYDIAFDKPETHVIEKGSNLYYSFFSKHYSGEVNLRGLKEGKYKIIDLDSGKTLGTVTSSNPTLKINFKNYMMIKAEKIN